MRTFDTTFFYPRGASGTEAERKDIVYKARAKLFADVRAQGLEPVPDTFRVQWFNDKNGRVTTNAAPIIGGQQKREYWRGR